MAVKEDARRCERCGQQWFAVRPSKAPKPRWFDEAGTPWGSGAARVTRLQGNYQRSQTESDRWARCQNCGSIKVKTMPARAFTPTVSLAPPVALSSSQQPPVQPDGVPAYAQQPPNPAWVWFKCFMKVHWRIVLAIFCTIGTVVMPFGGEDVGQKVGGTIGYFIGACVFWTLHRRYQARSEGNSEPTSAGGPVSTGTAKGFDTSVDDGWSQRVVACRVRASVFAEVGGATSSDVVSDWLSKIADDIDAQLATANELASLGRSLEPGFDGSGDPKNTAAREAWQRLGAFEAGLDAATTTAAEIRLNALSPAGDLQSVRTQLEVLQSQLPSLDSR